MKKYFKLLTFLLSAGLFCPPKVNPHQWRNIGLPVPVDGVDIVLPVEVNLALSPQTIYDQLIPQVAKQCLVPEHRIQLIQHLVTGDVEVTPHNLCTDGDAIERLSAMIKPSDDYTAARTQVTNFVPALTGQPHFTSSSSVHGVMPSGRSAVALASGRASVPIPVPAQLSAGDERALIHRLQNVSNAGYTHLKLSVLQSNRMSDGDNQIEPRNVDAGFLRRMDSGDILCFDLGRLGAIEVSSKLPQEPLYRVLTYVNNMPAYEAIEATDEEIYKVCRLVKDWCSERQDMEIKNTERNIIINLGGFTLYVNLVSPTRELLLKNAQGNRVLLIEALNSKTITGALDFVYDLLQML